ncbi:Eco57I restriction-modification methylase domain-containing protein [Paraburkholderia sediminicola]|uniref:Eco57I restriction-modification methylase domain-containing protein n=1 Tax=Paraburkholderia sediminicola TaxID=458836 RepID=UPI0038B831B2
MAELFGGDMQFDVVIGNPPYQLDDGGYGKSAAPIYHLFVEQAKKLEPRYLSLVIPARWFAGGKGLDEFRESMLTDNRLRSIDDYLSASDVFPGVGLKGGVCYFLWDRDNPGPARVTTHFKDWPISAATRPLLEEDVDVFIRFNEGLSILKKVMAVETGTRSVALPDIKRFDQLVSSRKPFGLETTFKGKAAKRAGDVLIYQNGGTAYTPRSSISAGTDLIDKWKVYVGRAAPGTGNRDTYPHRIISTPFIGEPGSISSETYLCIGPLDSKVQAESVLSYLSCRLTRLLILLHKPSQDTTRKVYTFVPTQDWTKQWTDKELYAKYDLSESEIAFIEKIVRPMDLSGETPNGVVSEDDE